MVDHIGEYLSQRRLELTPKTHRNYELVLRGFERFAMRPVELVTRTDVADYMANLLADGLERSTVLKYFIYLKTFYAWMLGEGKIAVSPCDRVKPPRQEKRLPVYLNMDELNRLFQVARVNPRDDIVVKILYGTGVRVSELVSISKRDIDFKSGDVRIFGKGSKERIVTIPPTFLGDVQRYCVNLKPSDKLFSVGVQTIEHDIKMMALMADIDKKISPHKLRHSHATHMYGATTDIVAVQESLGHSNISTTMIYTHLSGEHVRRKRLMLPMPDTNQPSR